MMPASIMTVTKELLTKGFSQKKVHLGVILLYLDRELAPQQRLIDKLDTQEMIIQINDIIGYFIPSLLLKPWFTPSLLTESSPQSTSSLLSSRTSSGSSVHKTSKYFFSHTISSITSPPHTSQSCSTHALPPTASTPPLRSYLPPPSGAHYPNTSNLDTFKTLHRARFSITV